MNPVLLAMLFGGIDEGCASGDVDRRSDVAAIGAEGPRQTGGAFIAVDDVFGSLVPLNDGVVGTATGTRLGQHCSNDSLSVDDPHKEQPVRRERHERDIRLQM